MNRHKFSRRLLEATARLVTRRPGWVVAVYLALAAGSIVLTALRLQFKTDQNDLVSEDLDYNQRFLEMHRHFGDQEFMVVVLPIEGNPGLEPTEPLDAASPEERRELERRARRRKAMEVSDAIAAELSLLTDHVEAVYHRIHPKTFGDSVLLLGTREELEALSKGLAENSAYLGKIGSLSSFADILRFVGESVDPAAAEKDREAAEWGFRVLEILLSSLASAAKGVDPPSLEASVEDLALGAGDDPRDMGYFFTGNLALVQIMPKKNYQTLEIVREPLEKIRAALDRIRARYPGIALGLTGRPVLQADEMKTTNEDMTRATILALLGVAVLFIVFFRRLRRPLLAVSSLMVGIALTFGLTTLTIGYLTLLSVVFAAMLVGMGIDFGVHFLARYQEELRARGKIEESVEATLVSTGVGIWTGGITTAASFYSTLFVHFKGLAELGFVAGTGLLLCMVTMLTFLPALVIISDRRVRRTRGLTPPTLLTIPGLGAATRRPALVLAVLGVVTLLGLSRFKGIPFNWNLLDLQAKGLESVEYELKIIEESDTSTWYAAYMVEGMDAVDRLLAALEPAKRDGIVGTVESIRDFVRKDEPERRAILKPAADALGAIRIPESAQALDVPALEEALDGLVERFDTLQSLSAKRKSTEDLEAIRAIAGLVNSLESIRTALEDEPESAAARLQAYQRRWFGELRAIFERFSRLLNPPALAPEGLPSFLRMRCVSHDGKRFLVHVCPAKDVWQEAHMAEFVQAIRKVDPLVTGVPIQVYESARLMRDAFLLAAVYSLILVFILILLDFREMKAACLTLVPLFVGLLWTLELMPWIGLQFNLANFFALPILVGYGVAGGVQVIHRFREFHSTADVGGTVSSAVALSFLTTIVGFGAMILASHRGVASLGMATSIGCIVILFASLVALPCLLAIVYRKK